MKLSDFSVLTFDCYGTLIDWEQGILRALAPLREAAEQQGIVIGAGSILQAFARLESRQQVITPSMAYRDLLAEVHGQLTAEWGLERNPALAKQFGRSVGGWPAFPDTVDALRYLKQHFRLVILSNVDRESFAGTLPRLGVEFDAIHTAQDIGSYKPDLRNFAYLLDRLAADGISISQTLHVAQSLFHDHAPANRLGLASAWIDRRHAAEGSGATAPAAIDVRYDFHFLSVAALAAAHRAGG